MAEYWQDWIDSEIEAEIIRLKNIRDRANEHIARMVSRKMNPGAKTNNGQQI